jgi:hypothetical protein
VRNNKSFPLKRSAQLLLRSNSHASRGLAIGKSSWSAMSQVIFLRHKCFDVVIVAYSATEVLLANVVAVAQAIILDLPGGS